MTRSELIKRLKEKEQLPTAWMAESIVASMLSIIGDAIADGDDVALRGLGSFRVAEKKARQRFNPNTRKYEMASAKKVVKYIPAKSLVDRLNGIHA